MSSTVNVFESEIVLHFIPSLRDRLPGWFWALALVAAMPASQAFAHDFWIEPSMFRPAMGATVALNVRVGEHFKGDAVIFNPEQFNRYVVSGPAGEQPVKGTMGDDPAGTIRISQPGLYTVLFESKKFDVSFDDFTKFESYLNEEGLERIIAFAKARAGSGGKIAEVYSRCAKTLIATTRGVATGAAGASAATVAHSAAAATLATAAPATAATASAAADKSLGCTLELIAESNPYAPATGDALRFRLLYKNAPVEGVLVVAFNKADPSTKVTSRTDKDGRASLKLTRPGVWLVKAVHMVVPARFTRGDWESFWASTTFELPAK